MEKQIFLPNDFEPNTKHLDSEAIAREQTTYLKDVWRTFKTHKVAMVSLFVLLLMVALVLFGPMLNEYNYYSNDYSAVNQGPSAEHWFGTDTLGRDMWTRVWEGGRISLLIAILATLIPELIGMLIGGISGYFGGWIDIALMRMLDVLMGIPTLIYQVLLMVIMGTGNVMTLVIAFSITGWMSSALVTRGMILQLRDREFVLAAKTLGASPLCIVWNHLIPNTMGIAVVRIAMTIPTIIFNEAFLSFIGLGVTPPQPSWGQLIKSASEIFMQYPYQFLFPCACIAITILCCNLLGDGLRDALDPKLQV